MELWFGGENLQVRKRYDLFRVLASESSTSRALAGHNAVQKIAGHTAAVTDVAVDDTLLDDVMATVRKRLVAHHAYEVSAEGVNVPLVLSDRIIVGPHRDAKSVADVLATDYALERLPSPSPSLLVFRLTNSTGMNPLKLVNLVRERNDVRWAEPDVYRSHVGLSNGPDYFAKQWHLADRVGPHVLPNSSIQANSAWEVTRGSNDIVLAIFDDGFDLSNADLRGNVVSPADFGSPDTDWSGDSEPVPGDTEPLPDRATSEYHGTPCAGLAIARGHAHVLGVAPGVSWMPVRLPLGTFATDSMVLRVFQYISRRADIVSCSWGNAPTAFTIPSTAMKETFAEFFCSGGRRGRGLVICFAAGNRDLPVYLDAASNEHGLVYYTRKGRRLGSGFFKGQAVHSGWTELDGVVVVGAVTSMNRRAHYSNWGSKLTVVAPSDNFRPDAPGRRFERPEPKLVTTDNHDSGMGLAEVGLAQIELGSITTSMGGTSGSAPLVAGVCALILSANPALTASEVHDIIKSTADRSTLDCTLVNPPENSASRSGEFDPATGHSLWFGFGKVNAHAAVLEAVARRD